MTATLTERIPQTIDAALIARAQAVCEQAADLPLAEESDAVTGALAELAGSLRFYHRIAAGGLAPEDAYEALRLPRYWHWPHEHRMAAALSMAAEDALAEAEEVTKVIAEQAETETAAEVSGTEGGEE